MRTLLVILLVSRLLVMFSPSGEAIRDKSLVLYFSFDEGKGNVVEDLSGYENDGTFVGGNPKWVDGKSGKALHFDISYYVEVPPDESLDLTETGHTISYWLKWDGDGGWSPFISKTNAEDDSNYHTWVGSDGVWDYCGNNNQQVHGKTQIQFDDDWNLFLTVTHDGEETVSFYPNGVLDNKETLPRSAPTDAPFRVGSDGMGERTHEDVTGIGTNGTGTIDEFTVFNRALNAKEIETLMKEGAKPFLAVGSAGKLTTTWGSLKNKRGASRGVSASTNLPRPFAFRF